MTDRLYARGGVVVDTDFARFGSKSYAIDKINTVDVRTQEPSYSNVAVLMVISGGFLIFGLSGSVVSLVICLIVAVIAYLTYRKLLPLFQLFLVTSSAEAQAFQSTDFDEITELRSAIERAMIQQKH